MKKHYLNFNINKDILFDFLNIFEILLCFHFFLCGIYILD